MTPHSGEICVTPLQVHKKLEIGKDQLRGTTDFIRICTFGILLAPHSDQSAISDRFRTTQHRHRQTDERTDGQNWYSNSRPDADALASVAKNE